MAKRYAQDHLTRLHSGSTIWNQWREDNPLVIPDLRAAELGKKNLDGYNLKKADLYRASLWKSSLNGADLTEADLSSVTLNGALLRSATLIRTNMRFARLVGADLTDATLCGCFPWLRPFVQPLLGAAFRWWLFRLTTFLLSLRSIEAQVE